MWFPAGLEMREPLDIAAIAGQVCELVEDSVSRSMRTGRSPVETGYFAALKT